MNFYNGPMYSVVPICKRIGTNKRTGWLNPQISIAGLNGKPPGCWSALNFWKMVFGKLHFWSIFEFDFYCLQNSSSIITKNEFVDIHFLKIKCSFNKYQVWKMRILEKILICILCQFANHTKAKNIFKNLVIWINLIII